MNIASTHKFELARRVKPNPIDVRAAGYDVVDTDFHFTPDWEALRHFMPEPFRSELNRYPLVGSDYTPKHAIGLDGTGQDVLGSAGTAADVLKVLDTIGVGTVVLSPGFQRPQSMFHQQMVSVLATAYNDYLVKEVFPVSGRIRASIMINHRDPEAGAAEIRRVGDHPQFVSVYTEFGGNYEPIGTARHDPIFLAAVERDLAVILHIGSFWQQFTPLAQGVRTWTELVGISSVATCMTFTGSMIMQGLFDKFPDLKVVLQEGGFWWLCDFMARADDYYLNHPGDIQLVERKIEMGERFLRKLPSEYFESNIRFSSQPVCMPRNPRHFKSMMELCGGEDMLMYSSDWPHATFDPLNWVFDSAVSEEGRAKILGGTARAWYPRLLL